MENKDLTDEILENIQEDAAEDLTESAEASEEQTAEEDRNQAAEEEAGSESEEAGSGEAGKEKRKFFGSKKDKKDKKDKQIEELSTQVADLTDRVKRNMAEFDNFRKRTEKEKSSMFEMGARSMIEKMLPVLDNFERGLAGVPEEQKTDAFVDGMDKVYKQLLKTLEEAGVQVIEAVGKPFDPNLHNAVMHVEDENLAENTIAAEFQKGYIYKGTVVRHSMVQVAN